MISALQKLSLFAAAIVVSIGLAGCSAPEEPIEMGTPGLGNENRPFAATDETVAKALKASLQADDVKFDGTSVKLYFTTGSVNGPTARSGCLSMQTFLGDGETGFKVYPDGEIDCSETD